MIYAYHWGLDTATYTPIEILISIKFVLNKKLTKKSGTYFRVSFRQHRNIARIAKHCPLNIFITTLKFCENLSF